MKKKEIQYFYKDVPVRVASLFQSGEMERATISEIKSILNKLDEQ